MSKFSIASLALVSVLTVAAGESRAQYYGSAGRGCGNTAIPYAAPAPGTSHVVAPGVGQSYQRYSYAPSTTGVQGTVVAPSAPMSFAAPVQSYRNYSYQPMSRGGQSYSRGSVGELWRYPKGDPRRQMR